MNRVSAGSQSRLTVLRGNSGPSKSAVPAAIRARYGRGIALAGKDNLRRVLLRERDVPGEANIGLIGLTARYALDHGFHAVVDGILYADHYADMLEALRHDHQGRSWFYYLDVPFEETMARHATRPQAAEFGLAEMQSWYRERDLLPGAIARVIGAASTWTTPSSGSCATRAWPTYLPASAPGHQPDDPGGLMRYAERRAREPAT